ncbi:MAG: NUDIX hydrolase [Planctomycetes bacterium]|nr:NUDIX hydrolase [Planctomycetota bacterium]
MPDNEQILLKTPRFDVVERFVETGPNRPAVARQVVIHPGAVTIVPLLEKNRVCLIRNFRVAVSKTLIELPAGTIDPNEPPGVTASRELQEETGYTADNWRELPAFFMSPGILNERMYVFVAEGLQQGPPAREAGEQIENLIVDWQDAVAMVERGEIEDAKTIVAILMWERLRQA